MVRGAAGASGPRDSGDVAGGGEPVPPGDPCFGYRVGSGYESVHADRRNAPSICVVARGHRLATPDKRVSRPVRWLVDGYNVIRRDADLRGREAESLEAGRAALLAAVAAAARRTGDDFTVVFDGARRDAAAPARGQVQVVFSRPPESADDVLRALAARAGAGTVVASSDRAVRDAARRVGAVAVSAEDFAAALRAPGRPSGGDEGKDDDDDDDRGPVRRGGNPRRLSRDDRAARRALARLRSI